MQGKYRRLGVSISKSKPMPCMSSFFSHQYIKIFIGTLSLAYTQICKQLCEVSKQEVSRERHNN